MSEDAILDYIDSKPFTKNLIQSKWQNNSMVLVLLLNGVMVMVTRFSTVILCLAAGISVLFLVLYWRFLPRQHGIARSAFLWRKRDCIPCCPFCRYFGVAGQ